MAWRVCSLHACNKISHSWKFTASASLPPPAYPCRRAAVDRGDDRARDADCGAARQRRVVADGGGRPAARALAGRWAAALLFGWLVLMRVQGSSLCCNTWVWSCGMGCCIGHQCCWNWHLNVSPTLHSTIAVQRQTSCARARTRWMCGLTAAAAGRACWAATATSTTPQTCTWRWVHCTAWDGCLLGCLCWLGKKH